MMKLSNQFRNLLLAWKNCLQTIKQAKIFSLFMLYGALQIILVLLLIFYAYPPFSSFLVPIIRKFFGEPALHYPNNFLVLPALFNWANLLLSGFIGIVLVGITTELFALSYRDKSINLGMGFRKTLPYYLVLLAVWFVETSLLLIVFLSAPDLLSRIEFFANKGNLFIQLVTAFLAVIIGAMFAYTTALIILEKSGVLRAVSKSLSLFIKYPIISLLLIGIPTVMRMPLELLASKTQFLISKFNPEMVGVVLILSILISIFANYFLVGTVTRYFLLVKDGRAWMS